MATPHPLPHTRTPTVQFSTAAAAAKFVAREIDKLVRARNAAGKPTVLGLATGSTPVGLYRELIRLHKEEGLDFSRVVTFNLDEYFPMPKEDPHSYFRWMHETFFNHVNIPWDNIHIPDGTLEPDDVDAFCAEYEKKIKAAGGIDVQILGIGRTGHIGFNEPGSPHNSRTAHGHARQHHPPRRGQRLLRRGERADPGDHDGRRQHPRRPARSS